MTVELAPTGRTPAVRPGADTALTDRAVALIGESLAPNTRRAYARWWSRWTAWCEETGRTALPGTGESLASFVAVLVDEGKSPASIGQAVGAIRSAHELAGFEDQPAKGGAAKAMRAHKRQRSTAGHTVRKANALTIDRLREVVAGLDEHRTADIRDRAMLLLGFAACLRRSNLVALDREDLAELRDRLRVTLRRSKTDQEGHGRVVDVPLGDHDATCPVQAITRWLEVLDTAGYTSGPVFHPVDRHGNVKPGRLTDHAASQIVGRRVDPDAEGWTGHSLRAGGATSMAKAGATTSEIADHGGWSPKSAVVHEYVRVEEAWRRHPMRNVGL